MKLHFITCGESHGKYLSALIEGMPSGLEVKLEEINRELWRRQQGYGRGARQKIEKDEVEVLGGVVGGKTTGAPVGFLLTNKDFKIDKMPELFRPRPGHADLAGALKYDQGIRAVLERASARETTMRVALGALTKLFLKSFGIEVLSHVTQIGKIRILDENLSAAEIKRKVTESVMNCASPEAENEMIKAIDEAIELGKKYGEEKTASFINGILDRISKEVRI